MCAPHPECGHTVLVPAFLAIFLGVRGAPVLLYRRDLAKAERLPFVLCCSVASVSLVIVITEIGMRAGSMRSDTAAALIGAGMLSVLLFPSLAMSCYRRGLARRLFLIHKVRTISTRHPA